MQLVSRDCCPYLDDHDHLDPNYVVPALAAPRGKGHSVRWDPAWLIADAIKTANPDPRYAKKEKTRSTWVYTGQPGAHAWDTEVGSNDWDTEDNYSDWNTEQSGSDDSDTEKSGPIDFYIGDDHDDHYDVHSVSTILGPEPRARWCDVEVSDDDEYADMQSLVDSDDDDRPHDLLSDETDEEEVAATDEYWRSFQPASRRTDIPNPTTTTALSPTTAAPGVSPSWSLVGRIDPKPVKLTRQGSDAIFTLLQKVHMVPSARKAVTGDGVCIGLTFKTSPFLHPKTQRNRELIEAVVEEVRSHKELRDVCFTSIQINHNTISAPHTDNNLIGTPSIAMGLGNYVGGRLRLEGAKQPLHIRDHAVVFNGRNIHSSGTFNGDRWSMVLFVHSSWVDTSPEMQAQLRGMGFPLPPCGPTAVAVPAAVVDTGQPGPSGAEEVSEGDCDEVLDSKPKKTLEEAQSREHRMTHLPKNPHCEVCSKAKMQRKPKRSKSSKPSAAEWGQAFAYKVWRAGHWGPLH